MKKQARRLDVERLEARDVPASFGTAWADPQHLTVSFAPDGTSANGYSSGLFASFNGLATTSTWQLELLRALQTWAASANINIAVVADGGQTVGSAGPSQGDARFGDIRIAAHAMPAVDVLALTSPYDVMAATRAGDIVFNTLQSFSVAGQGSGQHDLFTLALHEAGNALGLSDNTTDPNQVMYTVYTTPKTGLSWVDANRIQGLYGTRAADWYEGWYGNDSLYQAAQITQPNVEADLTTNWDADYYRYTLPAASGTTVTFQVQTTGVSLMTPKLTVYDASGQEVGTATSADPLGGGVSVQIANAVPGAEYFLKVEGGRADVFGVGRYRLKVHSGDTATTTQIAELDAHYSPKFQNVAQFDSHTNDTQSLATNLNVEPYLADPRFRNAIAGSVEDVGDADYYRIDVPSYSFGPNPTIVVNVSAIQGSALNPGVTVYDQYGNAVAADYIRNDDSTTILQVANATAGASYYVKVAADPAAASNATTGHYLLGTNFRTQPRVVEQLVAAPLGNSMSAVSGEVRQMTLNDSQVTHFVLKGGTAGSSAPTAVRMTVFDQNDQVIFTMTVLAGETVSRSVLLGTGTYRAAFVAATQDESMLPVIDYQLRAEAVTDPLDPIPINPNQPGGSSGSSTVTVGQPSPGDNGLLNNPSTNPWMPS
jgi:hypothetical protein